MSGHSHAKNIAHQKAATDQKRGQTFSKMVRLISIAVREGGVNLEANAKLKAAVERAKFFNVPNDNIERAIKQASGGQEGKDLSEFAFEAYGPGGIALIVEGITDNKNRTLSEIKQLLNQYNGKMAQEGSVRWLFDRKGVIVLCFGEQTPDQQNKESLEMKAIEAGAQDVEWQDDLLEVLLPAESVQAAKSALEKAGVKITSASVEWLPKEEIYVPDSDHALAQKLIDGLDENNDTQNVYSNLGEKDI